MKLANLENFDQIHEEVAKVMEQDNWDLCLLGQWLNFKLLGITYLVGEKKVRTFISGSIGYVSYGRRGDFTPQKTWGSRGGGGGLA